MGVTVLRAYGPGDLDLHLRLLGDPDTMGHLGGPETREQIERRHGRYLRMTDPADGLMLVVEVDGATAGTIGYWSRQWRDEPVWEAGWFVLPEHRGQGLASAALRALLDRLRDLPAGRPLHAFPSVDNAASNAVCARAGMTLAGETPFEYPPGHPMRCNDWWAATA